MHYTQRCTAHERWALHETWKNSPITPYFMTFLYFILYLIWQSPNVDDGLLHRRCYFVEYFSTLWGRRRCKKFFLLLRQTICLFCVHLIEGKQTTWFNPKMNSLVLRRSGSWVCGLFKWNIFVVDWLSSLCLVSAKRYCTPTLYWNH